MGTEELENDGLIWERLLGNLPNEISDDSKIGSEKKGKKRKVKERKEELEATSDHDMHIWTERERRKKMRNMFSTLHSLLPQLPPKTDKSTIVDEAVKYIKSLETTLQRLQNRKLERLQGTNPNSLSSCQHPSTREAFMADQLYDNDNDSDNKSGNTRIQTWSSSNVVLNICGDDAQFLVYAPKKLGLLASICAVLQKLKMEIISAHISSHANRSLYMIQARLAKGACDEFSEVITVEDRFKQAGAEIMMWVSS